jgi:hypothetical protein
MNAKIKKILFLLFGLLLFTSTTYSQIYVSTTGNDTSNTGTFDLPFKTVTKAISLAVMGDTIFVRGGVYLLTTTISIGSSKSGNSSLRYYLFAYGDERPLLDFSAMAVGSSNRGIYLRASYWYIKGIDIKGAGDNGMNISGSNNIIEFCALYENRDSGLQLSGGASNNKIINCDSYYNVDPGQGNADGFSPKLDVGTGNYFYGCRSWQNSDDGWDGYLRPRPLIEITTTLENCWCFMNGYLKSGSASYGNGNGYKMGGSDSANLAHNFVLKNCIAFDNRVKGFDQNNNRGSMTLYNCTGYNNLSKNYSISGYIDSGKSLTLKNCLVLGSVGSIGSFAIQATNSWLNPFTPAVISDFISVDTTGVRGPRKADGSLPDVSFLHLATGSQFIDSGTDIGLAYNGSAPDLGAFETAAPDGVLGGQNLPQGFSLEQNYPNPFNPSTKFYVGVPIYSHIVVDVFDILGRKVRSLVDQTVEPGYYPVEWKGETDNSDIAGSGIYFLRLKSEKFSAVQKIILSK